MPGARNNSPHHTDALAQAAKVLREILDHMGVDAIRTFLTRAVELTQGSFRLELLDAAYSDANIFQWNRSTAAREGRSLNERELLIFTVKNGKIVEVHHRPEQPALDEFYS